jgi:hypothetical protein
MADTTLYFVQSDTLPQIKLTITDALGAVRNLSNKRVSLHAKPVSGIGVRFSREASFPLGVADRLGGVCYIQWQNGDLNRAPGTYTAEIEVYDTSSGTRETIYDTFNIVIREDIGDIGPPYPSAASNVSPTMGPDPLA